MKPELTIYSALMAAGILISLLLWSRIFYKDRRMLSVYVGALLGAMLGGKLTYLLAEGWMAWGAPTMWQQWMTGKTILGALLGGYAGVEIGKWLAGYQAPTGDTFALMVPGAIALGRIGCLLQGCCMGAVCSPAWWTLRDGQGISRWPAVPVEIGFNLIALVAILILRQRKLLPGQHFHLYLIAYGLFRFLHEPLRDTPDVWRGMTGYQVAALLVAGVGVVGYLCRQAAVGRDTTTAYTKPTCPGPKRS